MAIREKAVKGFSWNMIEMVVNYAILFVLGIVLARILSPAEFGVIGILTIFIALFDSIVDCGFSNAIIRKDNVTDKDYNTIFIFNLVVSIVLYAILFFAAPAISHFFKDDLTAYTRVFGVAVIINALAVVQRTRLTKSIDFKVQAIISISATVLSGGIGVLLALNGCGVWSLIFQQLSKQTVVTALFWAFGKWKPKVEFDVSSFKDMFYFGWKVLVSGLIATLWQQINTLVIGKVYNKDTLGYYSRATQFSNLVTINLTAVIRKVSFPVMSEINNNDGNTLVRSYRILLKLIALISCFCLAVLAATAEPLIVVLIGEKWESSVPLLRISCLVGLTYALNVMSLNMLQVKGRSDLFLYAEIISKCIAVAPLLIGIFIGVEEMLLASAGTCFIMYIIDAIFCGKVIQYSLKDQLTDIFPVFITTLILFITVYSFNFLKMPNILVLVIQLLAAIFVAYGLIRFFFPKEYNLILNFIRRKSL